MVSEYLPYGPFDVYLREKKSCMKHVDLVEAGTYVASALWHLVSAYLLEFFLYV